MNDQAINVSFLPSLPRPAENFRDINDASQVLVAAVTTPANSSRIVFPGDATNKVTDMILGDETAHPAGQRL